MRDDGGCSVSERLSPHALDVSGHRTGSGGAHRFARAAADRERSPTAERAAALRQHNVAGLTADPSAARVHRYPTRIRGPARHPQASITVTASIPHLRHRLVNHGQATYQPRFERWPLG